MMVLKQFKQFVLKMSLKFFLVSSILIGLVTAGLIRKRRGTYEDEAVTPAGGGASVAPMAEVTRTFHSNLSTSSFWCNGVSGFLKIFKDWMFNKTLECFLNTSAIGATLAPPPAGVTASSS
ncbi:hypothetical protein L3Y34_003962 [Caenorhabditis briggsae]|uniref:Uncharacterized protein n=1 Tax=Caenorhabditis briggsae TaxID=6238 RepID=A0AAE9AH17_CAEBR|nr:hypothetical protein L3Y34_003962 [Caenorhabditis briggsae]